MFGIDASATNVSLFGLTITGGFSQRYTGSIANGGTLTITNSTISNNFTYEAGAGGIYNLGKLTIVNSAFSGAKPHTRSHQCTKLRDRKRNRLSKRLQTTFSCQ